MRCADADMKLASLTTWTATLVEPSVALAICLRLVHQHTRRAPPPHRQPVPKPDRVFPANEAFLLTSEDAPAWSVLKFCTLLDVCSCSSGGRENEACTYRSSLQQVSLVSIRASVLDTLAGS